MKVFNEMKNSQAFETDPPNQKKNNPLHAKLGT